jgi:hypothetical protein
MTRYGVLTLLVLSLGGPPQLKADTPISVTVTPSVTIASGDTRLKVLLERNEMNRALIWEVDGPNYYRSSAMSIEGASAAKRYLFTVRDLPEGKFEVRVTVRRTDNSQSVDRSQLVVIGRRS